MNNLNEQDESWLFSQTVYYHEGDIVICDREFIKRSIVEDKLLEKQNIINILLEALEDVAVADTKVEACKIACDVQERLFGKGK